MYQYLQHQQYFNDFDRDMIVVYEYKNNDNRNKSNNRKKKSKKKKKVKGLVMTLFAPFNTYFDRMEKKMDIVDSVKTLHCAGVFHLDLTWANIMQSRGNTTEIKLVDFQTCKLVADEKNIHKLCKYFLIDVGHLLALFDMEVSANEIKKWGNYYLQNKEYKVYEEVKQKLEQVYFVIQVVLLCFGIFSF